jgi:hypothetical protein
LSRVKIEKDAVFQISKFCRKPTGRVSSTERRKIKTLTLRNCGECAQPGTFEKVDVKKIARDNCFQRGMFTKKLSMQRKP